MAHGPTWREQRSLESAQCPEQKADFLIRRDALSDCLLHVSAAPTVYGGLVQCDTTTGRSVSAWYQCQELLWRRRPGDDAEFFKRFLFDQCWKEQVLLEIASLLASGAD